LIQTEEAAPRLPPFLLKNNSRSHTSLQHCIEAASAKEPCQKRTDAMSHNKWSNKYTTFAVGIGIGALLALLFAPSSGEETRDYISSSVKKGIDDVASTGKRWKRRAQETVDDVKSTVVGAVEAGQEAYRTVRDA
jgi:gas vesicle protein